MNPATPDGTVSLLLGDGSGDFGAATNFGVGRLDLVVANVTSNTASILQPA